MSWKWHELEGLGNKIKEAIVWLGSEKAKKSIIKAIVNLHNAVDEAEIEIKNNQIRIHAEQEKKEKEEVEGCPF